MGFLDNVSVFTKGVGAKAKGNYDVVAMNAQISFTKKEINELYQRIGEAYYQAHADSPESIVSELVNQVTEKFAHIDELNNQIEVTKAETASVQLTVSTDAPTTSVVNTSGRKCKQCGAPLSDDDLFCSECGTKNEIDEPTSVEASEEAVAEASAEEPVSQKIFCPECGTELSEEDVFCSVCGHKIK